MTSIRPRYGHDAAITWLQYGLELDYGRYNVAITSVLPLVIIVYLISLVLFHD